METPEEPWGFCETPEEKCTMNYCDDNGCQNRKRVLVSEPENLETLYRKVAVSDDKTIIGRASNVINHLSDLIHKLAYGGSEDLQEIAFKNAKNFFEILSKDFSSDKPNRNTGSFLKPDQKEHADEVFEFLTKMTVGPTTKDCECDKLQADKAELLEALEKCNNELHFYSGHTDIVKEIESLIQKHKL